MFASRQADPRCAKSPDFEQRLNAALAFGNSNYINGALHPPICSYRPARMNVGLANHLPQGRKLNCALIIL